VHESSEQRFLSMPLGEVQELYLSSDPTVKESQTSIPPLHRAFLANTAAATPDASPVVVTVWMNKNRPLSEPKWCRDNRADQWLVEQFGLAKANAAGSWKGKVEVVDPDQVSPSFARLFEHLKVAS
jgi:20S proteasome subunit alpha 6